MDSGVECSISLTLTLQKPSVLERIRPLDTSSSYSRTAKPPVRVPSTHTCAHTDTDTHMRTHRHRHIHAHTHVHTHTHTLVYLGLLPWYLPLPLPLPLAWSVCLIASRFACSTFCFPVPVLALYPELWSPRRQLPLLCCNVP